LLPERQSQLDDRNLQAAQEPVCRCRVAFERVEKLRSTQLELHHVAQTLDSDLNGTRYQCSEFLFRTNLAGHRPFTMGSATRHKSQLKSIALTWKQIPNNKRAETVVGRAWIEHAASAV
jgi:hypothetical protein